MFFDKSQRVAVRKELGFENKTVYAYMPTHRGTSVQSKNSSQLVDVVDYLSELDCYLSDSELSLTSRKSISTSLITSNRSPRVTSPMMC